MSKKFQKIVSVTTSVATIAWISGIGMLAPLAVSATTINEGDTIKTADNPDVYIAKYVGSKKFKRLILSPSVFDSYQHLSWGAIKTVTQAEMDQFTVSTLVRAEGDPKVYNLAPIANSDSGGKHWVNMTAEQFTSCNTTNAAFDWDSVYQINTVDRDNYTASTDDITCTLSTEGGVVPSTGTLAVSLSPSTAPPTTLVDGSAIANLASFAFMAPASSAVKVTTVKMKRLGVSADTTLSNVYLYDGAVRITDSASVSSGVITWINSAGIFTVPAGTTKTITVKSDIADSTAGQTVGVSINAAADIVTDGATVSGSFPINGNTHSTADGTLAGVSFGTVTPSSDGTPSPQNEFVLWQSTATITTRAVDVRYLNFRQIGSINNSDLANFKLYVDGVQVGSTMATLDSNGYVAFDLTSAPKRLEAGARVFKILVDLVGGSSRTTSLSLQYAADANITDTQYGSNILVQAASATFTARTSTAQTIGSGTLTVTKTTDSPTSNIVNGATNAVFAKFELKAAGESIKIESLDVAIHTTSNTANTDAVTFRNGALFANNVQIGSTAAIASDNDATLQYTRFTLGSSLIVVPGTPVILEVRADVYDDDGTNQVVAAWTVRADLLVGSDNARRMNSLGYFAVPSAITSGNTLTIQEGTVSLVKYTGYSSQTVVAPKTALKIGEWRLTAGTTETINLTALEVDYDDALTTIRGVVLDFSDCYLTYSDKTTTVKSTVSSSSDSYSINYALASGATIPIALYCNVASGTAGNVVAELTTRGTTALSAATADSTAEINGQTITITATGTLTTAATETPLDQLAYAGQTVESANYEITAANDTFLVSQVCVKFRNAANAAIVKSVLLYDGSTLLNPGGTVVDASGVATTTGLTWSIAANTTKTLTVKLELNQVGTNNVAAALNASTTLDTLLVYDSNGAPSYESTDREGNAVIAYKSFPTVALTGASTYTITNDSSQIVHKFTVTPSAGGSVSIKQFKFDLAWTDLGPTVDALELDTIKLFKGATDISDTCTIKNNASTTVKAGSGLLEVDTIAGLIIGFTSEETVTAATEYSIKATPRLFDKGTTSSDSVALTFAGTGDTSNLEAASYLENLGAGVWRLATAVTGGTMTMANFIWSDRSAIPHVSTSGSSSADWFNGYIVKSLPLDSVVLKP